jgi:undecaprenyl-diphosphatase
MFGATLKDLWDFHKHNTLTTDQMHQDIKWLVIGSAIAFIVALLAIKSFITFLEKEGFRLFGVYRIIAGLVIIVLYFTTNALHAS